MKIGELARESELNKQTIHYYRRLGMIPEPIKQGLNLHLYDQRHLKCLENIKRLRTVDKLSLEKIKEILNNKNFFLNHSVDSFSKSVDSKMMESSFELKQTILLETAAKLFSEKGFDAVRISDITEELGMGKSTFYIYFKNKEELFLSCIDKLSILSIPKETWKELKEEDDFFKKQAIRMIGTIKAFQNYSGMINMSRQYSRSKRKNLASKAKKAIRILADALENDIVKAQKKKQIRNVDSDILSHMILGMLEGIGDRLFYDSKYSVDQAVQVYVEFLKSGLALGVKE